MISLIHWTEQVIANGKVPLIKLHLTKDHLYMVNPRDEILHWVYQPKIELMQKVPSTHDDVTDFLILDQKNRLLLQSDNVPGIEVRSLEDLNVTEYIPIYSSTDEDEMHFGLAASNDQNDIYMALFNFDTEEMLRYSLIDHTITARTFKDFIYTYIDSNEAFDELLQLKVTPNQKWLVMNELNYGTARLHLFSLDLFYSTGECIKQESILCGERTAVITDFVCTDDSQYIVYFKSTRTRRFPNQNYVRELVCVSICDRKRLWQVPIKKQHVDNVIDDIYFVGRLAIGRKEIMCSAPHGRLLIFDLQTGDLLRKHQV